MGAETVIYKAALEDCEDIWKWWNDPTTRAMMKRNEYVPWNEHCAWFEKAIKDEARILCIGLLDSKKIGVVRFDLKGHHIYEVSINLNPAFRGKGLAPQLLNASIGYLTSNRNVRKLFASLKKINIPSMKTFERAGFAFIENPKVDHAGLERFIPESELYCERCWKLAAK